MNSLATIVLLVCLCITGITGYTTKGNKILDPSGKEVLLRGVDRPSLEWSATGQNLAANDYQLMAAWGSNVVRIALNQDYWLGLSSATSAAPYQAVVDQQVAWATAAGMGVILDLHWNIVTTGNGQENMADQHSITFWASVAGHYKSNNKVMFELYNEPHDVSWSVWLNGDGNYAGMQQLYNAVRGAGANNLVIVGGLNWAFDLSGVGAGYAVQGTNIAYATHPYDYDGKQIGDWPAAFGYLAATYPVIMTEFGQYCNTDTYVADLLTYATANGIHWTAWAWFVSGCSFPSIIADWNGTPISGVGELVKQYLSGNAPVGGSNPVTSAPGSSSSSGSSTPVNGATSALTVFSDSLASGWQDWSWAAGYSLTSTANNGGYVQSGSNSIKFPLVSFGGIYLHTTSAFQLGAYSTLQFYVNGGLTAVSASSLSVLIYGTASSNAQIGNSVPFPVSVPASQWSLVSIPLTSFGVAASTSISGFAISTSAGSASIGTIWIDSISFVPAASSGSTPTSPPSTPAPTTAPTRAPSTPAPTKAPTAAPTAAPTKAPTAAPTKAPTAAPTSAPSKAPTAAPTSAPTRAPSTPAPTQAPSTSAPTRGPVIPTAPSTGCGASSVTVTQAFSSSWPGSNGQTVSQYTVEISSSCVGKTLVGLTLAATNWMPVYAWNVNAVASASTVGQATVTLASYAAVTPSNPFSFGYQNVGTQQASFTITSATFQ